MGNSKHWMGIAIGILLALGAESASALPGQSLNQAEAWIQAHPTLRPARGEKLLIRKSDSPSRRFIFQASSFQVGRAAPGGSSVVRTEELSIYDMVNGVNRGRLEESLRAIYGSQLYQDYAQAEVVYAYPDPQTLGKATNRREPLLGALRGEVRQGDIYAYWLEIAPRPDGFAYTGKLTVFLKADLPKLEAELQSR